MKRIVSALLQTDLFKAIPEDRLDALVLGCRVVDVPRGGIIYRAGMPFEYLVLLCSGLLQSVEYGLDGRVVSITRILPKQLAGLFYLFGAHNRQETLVSLLPSQVIFLETNQLARLLTEKPEAARVLCEKYTQSIFALKRDNALLCRPAATGRILGVLGKFMIQEGCVYYLEGFPKQQEVADLANTTRETVSRTLSQLLNSGVLEKQGGRLRVIRPEMFGG